MRSYPAKSTIYDVDAALEAIEQDNRRQEEALRAFYRMRAEKKPVLVLKQHHLLALGLSALLACILGAYLLSVWLFPNM